MQSSRSICKQRGANTIASLSLVFDLIGRDISASKAFKDVGDNAERAGKRGEGFGSSIGKAMGVAAGAIAAVGVASFGKDLIGLASNAEQSMGGVEAVFKGYADTVKKSAANADTALGLSANSYRELATVIGSQLKNAGVPMEQLGGSTDKLISQGADLAAMFGGTTQEAVDALSSALKGEMDPIEKYGISLNDAALKAEALALGVYNGKGPLDANAKAMAVMSLVTKQGADSMGAFGRESDTAAGRQARATAQWENLKTTLGDKLLPIWSSMMGFVGTTVIPGLEKVGAIAGQAFDILFRGDFTGGPFAEDSGFVDALFDVREAAMGAFEYVKTSVIPALRDFAGWVQRNADIILPFVAALGAGYVVFQTIVAITRAWAAVQAALNVVMSMNPIGLVIVAIAALAAGLFIAYQKSETFRAIVDAAFRVIAATASWMWDNVLKPVFGFLMATFTQVANVIQWAWSNVIQPAWSALVAFLTFMWNNIVKPYFTFIWNLWSAVASGIAAVYHGVIAPVWSALVSFLTSIWNNVIKPTFTFIGDLWSALGRGMSAVYNTVIAPVWGFFSRALDSLKTAFDAAVGFIGRVWDGLKDKLRAPIKIAFDFVNANMIGPVNTILGKFPGNLMIPYLPRLREGGLLRGPGTGTSDSILGVDPRTGLATAAVSNGEFVVNAAATKRNRELLEAINSGALPGFADGGFVGLLGDAWEGVKSAGSAVKNFASDLFVKGARKAAGFIIEPIRRAANQLIPDKVPLNMLEGGINKLADAVLGKGDEQDKLMADAVKAGSASGGSANGLLPIMAQARSYVQKNYGINNIGGFSRRNIAGTNKLSDHALGKAIDIMTSHKQIGWAIANDLAFGIGRRLFNIENVIWQQSISSGGRPFRRMADRGSITQNHYDHVHADTYDTGGLLPPGLTLAYNGTGRNETIRTAGQEAALNHPAQFTGNLYLDSGEFLGAVRGVMDRRDADLARNVRSALG